MKSFDTDLMILETAGVGYGLRALNALTQDSKHRVLDASPIAGGRFLILIGGEKSELQASFKAVREIFEGQGSAEIVDHEVIAGVSKDVLENVFHLGQNALSESIIVVETETASALLASAQVLTKHGLKVLEIKIARAGAGGGHAYFTATRDQCLPAAEDVRTHLKIALREGKVELIENPSKAVRSLFEK